MRRVETADTIALPTMDDMVLILRSPFIQCRNLALVQDGIALDSFIRPNFPAHLSR